MATPLPVGSIIQVTIRSQMNSQTMLNVLHYETSGTVASDYVVALNALNTILTATGSLIPKMAACINDTCTILQISSQPVSPTRLVSVDEALVVEGGITDAPLPQNVAVVIEKRSDFATRWGTGSFHLGGLDATSIQFGRINGSYATLLEALATEIRTIRTSSGTLFNPCLWYPGKLTPPIPSRATRFLRTKVQSTSRVMRRRTVGVGI